MASQLDVRMYENKYPEVDDVVMVQVRAFSAGRDAAGAVVATVPWRLHMSSVPPWLHAAPPAKPYGPRGCGCGQAAHKGVRGLYGTRVERAAFRARYAVWRTKRVRRAASAIAR
jgi:hypothetical protein